MKGERARDRSVLEVTGEDRLDFLKGLVSRDVLPPGEGLAYAALLTPQGKYICDFLMWQEADRVLIDVASGAAARLVQRMSLYRLRAKVALAPTGLVVWRGLDAPPDGAMADPRHPALGWRFYGEEGALQEADTATDWDALRVAHLIPETDRELIADDTYILEAGFERLGGVDFRKGCYVGQEVTARMKHKTELRKGLVRVEVSGTAPPGTEITSEGKAIGRLFTQAGGQGIAWLRFDRAGGEMAAGEARLRLAE
ncbi:MAG: folate-binding protein YgfZ [Rhodobacteraceae bacterium]|nr:folate-binding protein YgfZ [Paracoccaceae bacterium]